MFNNTATASIVSADMLLDALIEDFPDMIHSVDTDGNLVYVNRMGAKLLGYTDVELLSMNIRQLYPPEILEAVEKGFSEVKQTGEKRIESLFMAKDGTRIPVELRTLVIRDSEGGFGRTFTVSRDLRVMKEMQAGLIQASKLAALGELAAGVAHDLNNPLTAIILAASIMKNNAASGRFSPEELCEQSATYTETVSESAEVMQNLTTRLRDFSRGVKEQHTILDLFGPINDALFILSHKLRHGNINVVSSVIKGKHSVLGDYNQIQQIFLNLFSNACDAMEGRDTRDLSISVKHEEIDCAPFWCCSVSDTGEGISPEVQDKVFKAFFTTKPRGKGTGLGLSICRTIASEHNGKLRLESDPGKGTTFSVLFPALTA